MGFILGRCSFEREIRISTSQVENYCFCNVMENNTTLGNEILAPRVKLT